MTFRPSRRSLRLIVALTIANGLVLAGILTGLGPEIIRLLLSVLTILALAQDWWQAREDRP